jgi:hypothetical protein
MQVDQADEVRESRLLPGQTEGTAEEITGTNDSLPGAEVALLAIGGVHDPSRL